MYRVAGRPLTWPPVAVAAEEQTCRGCGGAVGVKALNAGSPARAAKDPAGAGSAAGPPQGKARQRRGNNRGTQAGVAGDGVRWRRPPSAGNAPWRARWRRGQPRWPRSSRAGCRSQHRCRAWGRCIRLGWERRMRAGPATVENACTPCRLADRIPPSISEGYSRSTWCRRREARSGWCRASRSTLVPPPQSTCTRWPEGRSRRGR